MDAATVARASTNEALNRLAAMDTPEARAILRDCPVLDPAALEVYRKAVKASSELSLEMQRFLDDRDPKGQGAWLKASTLPHKALFTPWSLEILFLTAVRTHIRFSELEDILGISSRTLSTKLRALTDAGLLDRVVYDEQPVRIEYRCTKHGLATSALATPLFTHLNMAAIENRM